MPTPEGFGRRAGETSEFPAQVCLIGEAMGDSQLGQWEIWICKARIAQHPVQPMQQQPTFGCDTALPVERSA